MIYSDHKLSRIGFLFGSRIILEGDMIYAVLPLNAKTPFLATSTLLSRAFYVHS